MSTDAKRILVVDDDNIFRSALEAALKQEKFTVTTAEHGKTAQDLLNLQDFDVVVSDINMPGISGLDLLAFVRRTKPGLPVILMTGFAELRETAEAYENGAHGFLAKPFKKEELITALRAALTPKTAAGTEENFDRQYSKLSIDDFVSGNEIKFDIYVRLSASKYIKIAHQGENLPRERIESYKSKGILHLYMSREDFRKYLGFNLSLLPYIAKTDAISDKKKQAFLKHTEEVLLEQLHLGDVGNTEYDLAKTVVDASVEMLVESDELMTLLEVFNAHADHLYAHSVATSLYSVLVAREANWHSPVNLHKVAMGGLLHDIGKKELDRALVNKPRKDYTPEDARLYESHPQRGLEILGAIRTIPSDVLQIVLQHHEDCLGNGFPAHLPRGRIHPMARVVSVVNELCKLIVKGPDGPALKPAAAIQKMLLQADRFDPQFFDAMKRVFKLG